VTVSVGFFEASSDADIKVQIEMRNGFRKLRGWLHQVEPLLNPLLRKDQDAYIALMSFCHGRKPDAQCESCQKDRGLFRGCYILLDGACANTYISKLEGNRVVTE